MYKESALWSNSHQILVLTARHCRSGVRHTNVLLRRAVFQSFTINFFTYGFPVGKPYIFNIFSFTSTLLFHDFKFMLLHVLPLHLFLFIWMFLKLHVSSGMRWTLKYITKWPSASTNNQSLISENWVKIAERKST